MEEVMVAKLKKEDLVELKDLQHCGNEIDTLLAQLHSKQKAFWVRLHLAYNLSYEGGYYIKRNAIYRQEKRSAKQALAKARGE